MSTFVILDLEWIDNEGKYLTQLSAVRSDTDWRETARIDLLVKPDERLFLDPDHMAFGGYDLELFKRGMTTVDCMTSFKNWLEPEDLLLVWARSNQQFFKELWKGCFRGSKLPPIRHTADAVRKLPSRKPGSDPYAILGNYEDELPFPEHRASNDVDVLRQLFSKVGLTEAELDRLEKEIESEKQSPKKILQKRLKKNKRVLERTEYNFIYLKGSDVFHRRDCKAFLRARNTGDIFGSAYYATALNGRRPCKLCKPVPLPSDGDVLSYEQLEEKRREAEEKKKAEEERLYLREVINAKMLTGEVIQISRSRIVGWCHNRIHEGAINKSLLDEHDCLGKECRFFEKHTKSSYWEELEKQRLAKERRKEKERQEKARKLDEASQLTALLDKWSAYAEETNSDMYIVRIERETPSVYRIFYVSDNRFADGNRFPEFLEKLKSLHPRTRFNLRHIRDVDGHFVTREEYFNRNRNTGRY